jgi:putative drug exporter of the RND superfamily
MRAMTSILTFAAGRRAKWLVLLFWVAVLVVAFPFASKLMSAETNEASSYLPGNAESTKVLNLEKQFPSGQTAPASVVYHREGGLTAADRAKATADHDALVAHPLDLALPPSPPIPSQDGKAILFSVPFQDTPDSNRLVASVKALRAQVGGGPEGLNVKVTGPAGFAADSNAVFGDINGKLLLGTVSIVTLLLLITYRSPFLWLLPLIAVGLANQVTSAAVYGAARAGLTVNGLSAGILTVLIFGAGTDYALLLIARYREELRRHEDRHEAMAFALRQAGPAIAASGTTVTISLLCLLVAELNSNRGLGPVSAIGIVLTLIAMLTLLPALLVIVGRGVFWPFIPRYGSDPHEESGFWARIGGGIARRQRVVWVGATLLLGVLAVGLIDTHNGLTQQDGFRSKPDSVIGLQLIAESYPSGASSPVTIAVQPAANVEAARAAAQANPAVAQVGPVERAGDLARFDVTLKTAPSTAASYQAIDQLRAQTKAAAGPGSLVGGNDAINLDTDRATYHDRKVVMPLVLLVVLIVLGLLLRAIVAPVMLILTVILSFAASLGVSVVVFDKLFHFGGEDSSLPLYGFIFLVALGIDYNIFLMARAREESLHLGTHRGMLKGLAVTGGVITSAGFVLAGTFSVLAILPLVTLTEVGFIVAFGVLLDTLIVRSILVPALTLDIGARMWWPSRLANREQDRQAVEEEMAVGR